MALKSSLEIQEQIASQNAKIEAILAIAKEEDRQLTDDEQLELDAWHGDGTEGDEGEYEVMQKKLRQAKKIENRSKEFVKPVAQKAIEEVIEDQVSTDDGPVYSKIKVPARARRSNLKAFKGQDAEQEAFASGQWFRAMVGIEESKEWCNKNGIEIRAAQNEGTNSLGGFTVPDPLEASIIRIIEQHGKFRMFAFNKTMTALTDKTPRRVSGLQVYFPDEGQKIEGSQMTLDQVQLLAKKYACRALLSTELDEDSVLSMIDELTIEVGQAMALAEDRNGFIGDGSPAFASTTGIAAALAAVGGTPSVVTAAATSVDALTLGDYGKCKATIPDFPGMDPAWYVNKSVYHSSMEPLLLAAGGNTAANISAGGEQMFEGYPVRFVSAMPKDIASGSGGGGAAGDAAVYFGDLRKTATIGTRRGMTFKVLNELYAETDQIGLISTGRSAINVHEVGKPAVAAAPADVPNDLGAIAAQAAEAGPMVALALS